MTDDNKVSLKNEECEPCKGNMPPMSINDANELLQNLHPSWSINSLGHLERVHLLRDFKSAMSLAQELGSIAERVRHHPDLKLSYGKLSVEIWTHKINGLSRADFVLAAKFDGVTDK